MSWILASASPRRRQLLKDLVDDFEVIPATGEERVDTTLSPAEQCKALAVQKAREIASKNAGKYVLGADTVVAVEDTVLGKPKDEEDARRMLRLLSGRTHDVFTGVCIVAPDGREFSAVDGTQVRFYPLDEAFIEAYVKGGSPMDKAGAYGIQDGGLVEGIDGSYTNVVGLPIELCDRLITKIKESEK